jgi:hypothetical protein
MFSMRWQHRNSVSKLKMMTLKYDFHIIVLESVC